MYHSSNSNTDIVMYHSSMYHIVMYHSSNSNTDIVMYHSSNSNTDIVMYHCDIVMYQFIHHIVY